MAVLDPRTLLVGTTLRLLDPLGDTLDRLTQNQLDHTPAAASQLVWRLVPLEVHVRTVQWSTTTS